MIRRGLFKVFWYVYRHKNPYQGVDPRRLDLIYLFRPLFGNPPIYRVLREMLDDRLLCRQLGFTDRQIDKGLTRRKDRRFNPIGEKTIGNYGRWWLEGLNQARLRQIVLAIGRQKELPSKVLTMDCTFIETYGSKMEKRAKGYDGTWGYKVGVVHQADHGREYILAARIYPANRNDSGIAPDLIEDLAYRTKLKGKLLLVDKGFQNEPLFEAMKEKHGLSVLIRLRSDTNLEHLAINRVGRRRFYRVERAPGLVVARLRMKDYKSGMFDVIAVQDERANRDSGLRRKAWSYFLTTDRSMSPLKVYRTYARRWLIENQVFKKLKWDELHLTPLNSGNWNFINLHVFSSLMMRNILLLYSRKTGTSMDEIIRIIGAKKSEAYFRRYGNRLVRLPDDEVRTRGITRWIGSHPA